MSIHVQNHAYANKSRYTYVRNVHQLLKPVMVGKPGASVIIVTRKNIVWKLACSYCLCYCKTFSLVPDFTGCIKNVLLKRVVHYLCHLKSNNIIGQRKTTNKEKHFYP